MGIIGKTQGVTSEIAPQNIPCSANANKPSVAVLELSVLVSCLLPLRLLLLGLARILGASSLIANFCLSSCEGSSGSALDTDTGMLNRCSPQTHLESQTCNLIEKLSSVLPNMASG